MSVQTPVPVLMRLSVYIAASVDGFIARPDGDISWLATAGQADTIDYGFAAFMEKIDALIMGRRTFEKILTFPAWPYPQKRVIILSRTQSRLPKELSGRAELSSLDPLSVKRQLEKAGARHVWIDGGLTIQSFLAAGLITDLTVTWVPVLLGKGFPLFGHLDRDILLTHQRTASYPNGCVQSTYQIRQPGN